MPDAATLARWKADPVAFIAEVLRNPETGQPFELYPAQERFLREALTLTADGRLPYPELLYYAPKKSGKTATSAMAVINAIVVIGGPYGEAYVVANDLEQSTARVSRRSRASSRFTHVKSPAFPRTSDYFSSRQGDGLCQGAPDRRPVMRQRLSSEGPAGCGPRAFDHLPCDYPAAAHDAPPFEQSDVHAIAVGSTSAAQKLGSKSTLNARTVRSGPVRSTGIATLVSPAVAMVLATDRTSSAEARAGRTTTNTPTSAAQLLL